MNARPAISVVIKTFNEELNIARTLQHVLDALSGKDAEVIVADSLSTDRTVEIARAFPVRIFTLLKPEDRGCGVGAQLGFQHSTGDCVLVMDGDMDIQREFIFAAMARLAECPGLAGVGGVIEDVNFENIEYRARRKRASRESKVGEVDRLNGGGLFRREAINSVGYLTNRNLHACEELEQGLRLLNAGWKLERLPMRAAWHHGHTAPMWSLIRRRWQSRYTWGAGELLRSAIGHPYFGKAVRALWHPLGVLVWWSVLVALLVSTSMGLGWVWFFAALLAPLLLMVFRKKSVVLAAYSMIAWTMDALGLAFGFLVSQTDPMERIPSVEVDRVEAHDPA